DRNVVSRSVGLLFKEQPVGDHPRLEHQLKQLASHYNKRSVSAKTRTGDAALDYSALEQSTKPSVLISPARFSSSSYIAEALGMLDIDTFSALRRGLMLGLRVLMLGTAPVMKTVCYLKMLSVLGMVRPNSRDVPQPECIGHITMVGLNTRAASKAKEGFLACTTGRPCRPELVCDVLLRADALTGIKSSAGLDDTPITADPKLLKLLRPTKGDRELLYALQSESGMTDRRAAEIILTANISIYLSHPMLYHLLGEGQTRVVRPKELLERGHFLCAKDWVFANSVGCHWYRDDQDYIKPLCGMC
ncbi:hypothetical protein KIPB_009931, partial [Kipferlia bialata]